MWQSHIPRRIKTCIMQLFEKILDFYNIKKMPKKSLNISARNSQAQEKFTWILTFLTQFFFANKS